MYCGDETGSFIGDVGSSSSRFGYGGEDSPKYVVPSCVLMADEDDDDEGEKGLAAGKREGRSRRRGYVATSCYNYRQRRQQQQQQGSRSSSRCCTYRTPLRTVETPPGEKEEARMLPVVDPNLYLQQGDSIADWDAFEELWQSAFDALNVRDKYKHTRGGAGQSGNGKVQSTTIRSFHSPNEGKASCSHPALVVAPGCTHRVVGRGSGGGGGGEEATATAPVADPPSKGDAAFRRKETAQIAELMFEKMGCEALFVAPSPMLAAFSHGRQTALVVDVGASGCRVTPVVDGLVLRQAQRRNGRGGDWLGNLQWHALLRERNVVRPRYQVGGGGGGAASALFHRWAMQDLMHEFRTSGNFNFPAWSADASVPFVYKDDDDGTRSSRKSGDGDGSDDDDNQNDGSDGSEKSGKDEKDGSGGEEGGEEGDAMQVDGEDEDAPPTPATKASASAAPGGGGAAATYELPDGTLVDLTNRVGRDLCRIPELLFAEELPFLPSSNSNESSSSSILRQHETLSDLPLPQLIRSALSAVGDVDARKDLASSIILTGGSSLIPNLEQRLSYELPRIVSSAYKCKVLASKHSIERSCAPWIGGSILTSLGSFQQLWLSRTEYEQYGAILSVERFP